MMTSISFLFILLTFFPFPLKVFTLLIGLPIMFLGAPVQKQHMADARQAPHIHRAEQAKPNAKPVQPAQPDKKKAVVKPIKLMVNLDGSYQLMGEKVTKAELSKKLKVMATATPKMPVEIVAEANTPHQMVANAMELCREAGVINLIFSSRPASP